MTTPNNNNPTFEQLLQMSTNSVIQISALNETMQKQQANYTQQQIQFDNQAAAIKDILSQVSKINNNNNLNYNLNNEQLVITNQQEDPHDDDRIRKRTSRSIDSTASNSTIKTKASTTAINNEHQEHQLSQSEYHTQQQSPH